MATEADGTDSHDEPGGDEVARVTQDDSVSSYGTIDRYGFISRSQRLDLENDDQGDDGDSDDGHPDVDVIRKRESKWLDMLQEWRSFMRRDYKKVRSRCRKGIPASVRPEAWAHLCAGKFLMASNPGVFESLHRAEGRCKWDEDIEKDLHRNFPTHELFGGCYERIGQKELFRVLRAYSLHRPDEGYCQAQAPVAGLLLMSMPSEQAFWCLVSICDRYLPGYYSPGMKAIQLDAAILMGLLNKVAPKAHAHLIRQEVEPLMFMTEWFLCAFTRALPWSSVLRVWDMFVCEGVKVLFKVGLVLIKHTLTARVIASCPTLYETLTALKTLPSEVVAESFLIDKVLGLKVDEADMKKQHSKQLRLQKAKAGSASARRQTSLSPTGRFTTV